jgi:hypothetical protein
MFHTSKLFHVEQLRHLSQVSMEICEEFGLAVPTVGGFAALDPALSLHTCRKSSAKPLWIAANIGGGWLLPSLLLISVTALLALAVFAFRRHDAIPAPPSQAVSPPVRSVAVLPFTGGADNSDDQYMGIELADAVAVRLMTVPQLGVRSSATVRSVLGLHADASLAGKKLAVMGDNRKVRPATNKIPEH